MSSLDSAAMDGLHKFIRQQANNSAEPPTVPPGFIGPVPPPPSSVYIGQRYLKDGPSSEPIVTIMFRCVWPPGPAHLTSRHVLMQMRPSVQEEDLATKLYQVFEILQTGGVITKTVPKCMPGLCPLTISNKVYNRREQLELLGSTKTGFMDVTVVPVAEMNVCSVCGNRKIADAATIRSVRKWCYGVNSTCMDCYRTGRIQDNVIETCLPHGQVLPVFHI